MILWTGDGTVKFGVFPCLFMLCQSISVLIAPSSSKQGMLAQCIQALRDKNPMSFTLLTFVQKPTQYPYILISLLSLHIDYAMKG